LPWRGCLIKFSSKCVDANIIAVGFVKKVLNSARKIEQYRELLDSSNNAGYNFSRWPILGEWVWPNFFVGQTYKEEVDCLKEWTLNRTAWLDEQISQF